MAGSGPASAELPLPQHPTSLNPVQPRQSHRSCYFLRCRSVVATNALPWRSGTLNKGCPTVLSCRGTHTLSHFSNPLRHRVHQRLKLREREKTGVPQCPQAALRPPPPLAPPSPPPSVSAGVDPGGPAPPHAGPPALPLPGRG